MSINIQDGTSYVAAKILSGATVSDDINLGDKTLSILIIPAMTGTSISFQVSIDGANYYELNDSTKTAVSVTCDGTARAYYLDPVKFAGVRNIKLVSNSAEGADRDIYAIGVKAIESNY